MGGITSASREAVRPVVDKYSALYFYNEQYEGGVCDKNRLLHRGDARRSRSATSRPGPCRNTARSSIRWRPTITMAIFPLTG